MSRSILKKGAFDDDSHIFVGYDDDKEHYFAALCMVKMIPEKEVTEAKFCNFKGLPDKELYSLFYNDALEKYEVSEVCKYEETNIDSIIEAPDVLWLIVDNVPNRREADDVMLRLNVMYKMMEKEELIH